MNARAVYGCVIFALVVACLAGGNLASPAAVLGAGYPIYYDEGISLAPQVNDRGHVAWLRQIEPHSSFQVYLYDGERSRPISDDSLNHSPVINNKGWVAWASANAAPDDPDRVDPSGQEIFLYNGEKTIRLTNNNWVDYPPVISDNGWVAWLACPDEHDDLGELHVYNGREIKRLTYDQANNNIGNINKNGWVVYSLNDGGSDQDIYVYNGTGTIRITHGGYNVLPRINDKNWIAWSTGIQPMLYNGRETTAIPLAPDDGGVGLWPASPQINNNGWVAWGYWTSSGRGPIYVYDGTDTTKLAGNATNPSISDMNWVTWNESDGRGDGLFLYDGSDTVKLAQNAPGALLSNQGWATWVQFDGHDNEIYLYDGKVISQLTNNNFDDSNPSLSNITWEEDPEASGQASAASIPSPRGAPPRVRLRAPKISTQVSSGATVTVRWSAYDPAPLAWKEDNHISIAGASGVKNYGIQVKAAGSESWTNLLRNTTSKHVKFAGKPGGNYFFRVAAVDKAGNRGWSATKRTIIPFDHRVFAYSGTWRKITDTRLYKGSSKRATAKGAAAVMSFRNARGLSLVATKSPYGGYADVYIGKSKVKTIGLYGSHTRRRTAFFIQGFTEPKSGNLKVVVNHAKPPVSKGYRVELDGVAVRK